MPLIDHQQCDGNDERHACERFGSRLRAATRLRAQPANKRACASYCLIWVNDAREKQANFSHSIDKACNWQGWQLARLGTPMNLINWIVTSAGNSHPAFDCDRYVVRTGAQPWLFDRRDGMHTDRRCRHRTTRRIPHSKPKLKEDTHPEELALARVADAQGLGGHSGRITH